MGQRVGVFGRREATGEADRRRAKHAHPQDVQRRGWVQALRELSALDAGLNVGLEERRCFLEELEALKNSPKFNEYSKKMQSSLNREYRKMFRNLDGIRTMNRLPECLVIVDPKKEKNAVSEAQKLGIATVALIDTDCDPDVVDLPIPGNDDSMRSIELVVKMLCDAIASGKNKAAVESQHAAEGAEVAMA